MKLNANNGLLKHGKPLKLGGFLPYRLSILSNRVSGEISRLYVDRFGISVPEWRVIAILGEQEASHEAEDSRAMTSTQVAQRTAMDKVAVTRAVQQLSRKGFLQREASRQDRRVTFLSLSATGWDVYREIAPLALEYESELLETLNPAERKHLDDIMAKLHQRLDALDASALVGVE